MKKLIPVLFMILLILAGCGGGNNISPSPQKGAVTLAITSKDLATKTIQPNIDLTIATYNVYGAGPSGTNFRENGVTGSSVTIYTLTAGSWTITADALNSAGTIIASGNTTVTIANNQTANANITVTPLSGTGTVSIGLSWPAGVITSPVITASLTPQGGTASNITFVLVGDHISATYQNNDVNAGYYTLLVYLYDGSTFEWGAAEAVRVMAGQTSNGSYQIIPSVGFGNVNLNITPDLQNPIGITFSGGQNNLAVGTNLTVTATTSQTVDSYQWYLNGRPLPGQTGASITIGSSLGVGSYRLDLVVTKGNIISSGTVAFSVAGTGGSGGQTAVVTTFAGLADQFGSVDGVGTVARFNGPVFSIIDNSGNLYVTDMHNDTIRKITPAGVVTTIAGTAGQSGSTDGTGSAARFNQPYGITIDSSGNLYVVEHINNTIRKVTPAGVVSTFAGTAGQSGSADGTGMAARFNGPIGITIDSSGNLFVSDNCNHTIRKITPPGVVSTIAGTAGQIGSNDGTGTAARFNYPTGITIDGSGNLYVVDSGNSIIRKVNPAKVVTTIVGTTGQIGSADGTGTTARFYNPVGITIDSNGNLYVADFNNGTIRKITPVGVVTTIAGIAGQIGSTDGLGTVVKFYKPHGINIDVNGNLYVDDPYNNTIRKITFQ